MSLPESAIVLAADSEEASWLTSSLSALYDLGLTTVSVRRPSDGILTEDCQDFDVVIVDSSLGYESALDTLYEIMRGPRIIPVLLCLREDEREEFADAILYGIQELILKDQDATDVLERLLLNSVQRCRILVATADAESRVRVIIENISDGVLIADEARTILFANPASEILLGKQLIDLMGAPLELTIPEDLEAVVEVEHEFEENRILAVKWVPVRWEGRDVRLYTMRDVTERHSIQKELASASDDAARLSAMKSSFMANMSHELRLPLASIIGFGQLIEADEQDPDLKEFAASIVDSGNKLLQTVNSVLDLTRLDAQEFEMSRIQVSVEDAAGEVVRDLKTQADEKGLSVTVETIGDSVVQSDPIVLRRVLSNVIGNAVKFTEAGGVTVTIRAAADKVVCAIQDTGIGIDKVFLDQIFDDFSQESVGASRAYNGAGLGLAVTQRLLSAMNGSITVSSEKNSGSTFTIVFPRHGSNL